MRGRSINMVVLFLFSLSAPSVVQGSFYRLLPQLKIYFSF